MAGIRLEFAQYGDFDTFDVIRSTTSLAGVADVDLPSPIVTGLTTMYYVDSAVVVGTTYYYKVRVNRDGTSVVSDQIAALAGILWTPLNLTTTMYFSADSVVKDGSNRISQLTDLSGNNRHATQSVDVYKPVLSTFSDGSLAMQFDGVNDYFWQSNTSYLNNVAGSWAFSVELMNSKTGYTYLLASPFNSSGASKFASGYSTNKPYVGGRRQYANAWSEAVDTSTRSAVQNINFSQVDFSIAKAYVFINAAQVAINNSFGTAGNADSTAIFGTSIGAYVGNNGSTYEGGIVGKVGCIIVGTGVLSTENRQRLEGWAAHKYGLQANLPGDHPYKNIPPLL